MLFVSSTGAAAARCVRGWVVTGGPYFFFFQAEDGIRDVAVTGVQTCALPIWPERARVVAWTLRLDGSAAHPDLDHNAGTLGPVVGWRERYRAGLRDLDQASRSRSEERRVGEEGRSRGAPDH